MPIERLRMRPWLENALNEHKFPGVEWVDKDRKIFRLPWKHASRNGWKIQTDASLFRAWAEHTGKYKSNDKPNPKTWKANFRCALNSLPDMEELIDRRTTKGNNAFKMYRIVNNVEKKSSSARKMKGRNQRKKRSFSKTRSVQKDSQIEKTDTDTDMEEDDQSYESSPRPIMKTEYQCIVPQLPKNGTHLVDHDYAATRYFDIFNDSTDDDMQEVFDVPESAIVKTEPLSPKDIGTGDEFSLYEESRVDSKNFKTSCTKEDKKIMSDDEVVKLIDELSSHSDSPSESSDSVNVAMEELLDRCMDTFDAEFSERVKQRASSAPGMLETPFETLGIFCPSPSIVSRNKSSTDIEAMLSTTPQELLQSCLA